MDKKVSKIIKYIWKAPTLKKLGRSLFCLAFKKLNNKKKRGVPSLDHE